MAEILYRLRNVVRNYGEGQGMVRALRGVDLDIYEGELLSITGMSGSGKSTLLHILSGLQRPTSGEVTYMGKNIALYTSRQLADFRGREVGVVFQDFKLIPRLSIYENLMIPLIYARVPEGVRRGLIMDWIARIKLMDRAFHRSDLLSGGEKQRVALARAMILHPKVILADEPTGSLDHETGTGILDELLGLHKEGATVIIVTHEHRIAEVCPRRVHISEGRLGELLENRA